MSAQQPTTSFAAFVGIDWAHDEHAACVIADGRETEEPLVHSPEEIAAWVARLQQQFGDAPIAVALEQKRGALINVLVQHEQLVLFPINPKQLSRYREALFPSGSKSDPADARLLARFLREQLPDLRPLRRDDPQTRRLGLLCELRRKAVDNRKKEIQKLTDTLKQYFPLVLQLCKSLGLAHERTLALIARWPTHRKLQRAHPDTVKRFLKDHGMRSEQRRQKFVDDARAAVPLTTDKAVVEPMAMWAKTLVQQIRTLNASIAEFDEQIEQLFNQHQDAELFRRLPGAGDALAPRLAAAFGRDRSRFEHADDIATASGIAPVTRASGRSQSIQKRVFCPKFLRQTFHEFADHSRHRSRWANAYYRLQRSRGKKHSAAVRALAFKWIRILFRVWKTGTAYDESHYLQRLQQSNSPIMPFLEMAA